jgi:xyloglucan 6-xylosyltransferase
MTNQGYWVIVVDKYEDMRWTYHPGLGDERWPFVTHFMGCNPCGSYGYYPVERCLKIVERAFNFADNQIIQIYGFKHNSLNTTKVNRTRNKTSSPLEVKYEFNLLHPLFTASKSL